ncbi:MAG: hypothetical protein Kow0069_27070 [Promethearchaeota archaeon]
MEQALLVRHLLKGPQREGFIEGFVFQLKVEDVTARKPHGLRVDPPTRLLDHPLGYVNRQYLGSRSGYEARPQARSTSYFQYLLSTLWSNVRKERPTRMLKVVQ